MDTENDDAIPNCICEHKCFRATTNATSTYEKGNWLLEKAVNVK